MSSSLASKIRDDGSRNLIVVVLQTERIERDGFIKFYPDDWFTTDIARNISEQNAKEEKIFEVIELIVTSIIIHSLDRQAVSELD